MAEKPEIVVIRRTIDGLVRIRPAPPPASTRASRSRRFSTVGSEGQNKIGVKFRQINHESKDVIQPLTKGLDSTASDTADQIAQDLNRPKTVVE